MKLSNFAGDRMRLLRVLAALFVLAMVVLLIKPSIDRARERRWRIHCMGNLRNIGLATRQYAADHNGLFPESCLPTVESNFRLLSNVTGNAGGLFVCGSDRSRKYTNHVDTITDANISYGYVRGLHDSVSIATPFCFDRGLGMTNAQSVVNYPGRSWLPADAHGADGGMVLYAGGHAEFRTTFPVIPLGAEDQMMTNEALVP
jgi:hypothetical protein